MLRGELDELAKKHPDQFKVWYTVDKATEGELAASIVIVALTALVWHIIITDRPFYHFIFMLESIRNYEIRSVKDRYYYVIQVGTHSKKGVHSSVIYLV